MASKDKIIRSFNRFPGDDLKSMKLVRDKLENLFYIYIKDRHVIMTGPPIIFNSKIYPNTFMFKVFKGTDKKTLRKFKQFEYVCNNILKSLASKLSRISKEIYGRFINYSKIKAMMYPVVTSKGDIHLRMFDKLKHRTYGKEKDMKEISSTIKEEYIDEQIKNIKISKEEADKIKKKGEKVYQDRKKPSILFRRVKDQIKREKIIKGVNLKNFSSKFRRGTQFSPKFIINYLELFRDKIEVVITPYELSVLHKPVQKFNKYKYVDNDEFDEESDPEFLSDDEENKEDDIIEVELEVEKTKKPVIEIEKEEVNIKKEIDTEMNQEDDEEIYSDYDVDDF